MKPKKMAIIVIIILCSVWAVVAFLQRPISVTKEVAATVYTNGVAVSKTTIFIDGMVSEKLFSEEATYIGLFQIAWYERSSREGTEAKVKWLDSENQYITFFQAGNSSTLEIEEFAINNQMEEIAIAFKDGTIIATSENIYLKYSKSLSD
jgi:hypothetical protein